MKYLFLFLVISAIVFPYQVHAIVPASDSAAVLPTLSPLQSKISKLRVYEEGFQKMDMIQMRLSSRLAKMKSLGIKPSKIETDMTKLRSDLDQTHEMMKKLNSEMVFSNGTAAEVRTHDLSLKQISKRLVSTLSSEKTIVISLKKLVPTMTPSISTVSGGIRL